MRSRRVRRRGWSRLIGFLFIALAACLTLLAYDIFAKPARLIDRLNASYKIVDLSSGKYHVSPAIATSTDGCEYFTTMITRLKPYAAITGTYYDPDYKPLGDIVMNGKVIYRGCQRQGIGFTRSGKIRFFERKGHSRIDWSGCESGIACGPRLIRDGKKDINVKRDGFSSAAATNTSRRCAVGSTRDGKLILLVVDERITLETLAKALLELGAWNAINMDGGRMCAFYENGNYHVTPAMPVSNILGVYSNK